MDLIKLGYLSRALPKDNQNHVILGTQAIKPRDFAAQVRVFGGRGAAAHVQSGHLLRWFGEVVGGGLPPQRPAYVRMRDECIMRGCRWAFDPLPPPLGPPTPVALPQINLSMDNCWGVVKALLELCHKDMQADGALGWGLG